MIAEKINEPEMNYYIVDVRKIYRPADLHFSAAHFTIFSATERERLHGHNYSVSARFVAPQGDNGFSADHSCGEVGIMGQFPQNSELPLCTKGFYFP